MALYHSYSGRSEGVASRSVYRRPLSAKDAPAPEKREEEAAPASCFGDCASPSPARPVSPAGGRYDCSELASVSLAMVYAPCQAFSGLYAPEKAIGRGTLFQALDKPLAKEGGRR